MRCELRELCSPYLLGMLSQNEQQMYEQHLLQGCAECSSELTMLSDTIELLARAENPIAPDPGVKERLISQIRSAENDGMITVSPQVWKHWRPVENRSGLMTMHRNEGEWENTGIEGISVKQLFSDPDKETITMLVRMAGGTAYPSHRHGGVEECYVIEGDLHVGDELVLYAGDYQRANAESVHLKQWTENGCLLFIVSSTGDELVG